MPDSTQRGIFFSLHAHWHHWLLHPVRSGFLNAAACGGQMRLVWGLISFAVSLRNAFSSPVRCPRCCVTLLLIRRDSSAVSPFDFYPIGPLIFILFFCLWPWEMRHRAGRRSPACWSFYRASKWLMAVNGKEKATLFFSKALEVNCGIVLPSTSPPPPKLASELLWPEHPHLATSSNYFLIAILKTASCHPKYKYGKLSGWINCPHRSTSKYGSKTAATW